MSGSGLLLDEMLSPTIAVALRDQGHDAIAVVADRSLVGRRDDDALDFAAAQRRVLVTANIVDFATLANAWRVADRTHPGIVFVAHRTFPPTRALVGEVAGALVELCSAEALSEPGVETFSRRAGIAPLIDAIDGTPRAATTDTTRRAVECGFPALDRLDQYA